MSQVRTFRTASLPSCCVCHYWEHLLCDLHLCFALVGTLLGAMTGALIGQETESGFVRGAAVGAISGAVFSIEVFESSLVLWQSDESGIGCVLYLGFVISDWEGVDRITSPPHSNYTYSIQAAVQAGIDMAVVIFWDKSH
ncbi:hypothetical protein SO802_032360 [Lithocarpus litseifolius]|uniref:YMGG-like Gly-zipper domain-containing protein n=1 Tax=Lithocarpus litseifolius TaxID=425828 RepID=A0AAW2BRL0_9ROSI